MSGRLHLINGGERPHLTNCVLKDRLATSYDRNVGRAFSEFNAFWWVLKRWWVAMEIEVVQVVDLIDNH